MDSLAVVRAYIQYLHFNQPVPRDIEFPKFREKEVWTKKGFFPWELELLAKELILHAQPRGKYDLRKWHDFAAAINRIKNLEDSISGESINQDNVLHELSRIAHRQFHWQHPPDAGMISRYYRIFAREGLAELIERKIGLEVKDLYTIGCMTCGGFLKSTYLDLVQPPAIPNLSSESFKRFIERFAIDIRTLRNEIEKSQKYDENFAYAFNPLRTYPIILTNRKSRPNLICPLPTLLFNRFTSGIYYEIHDEKGFSDAFGQSFQLYVGEAAKRIDDLSGNSFQILGEKPYESGQKHSIDWIISDDSAHIFLECKTKRMRLGSKQSLEMKGVLEDDISKLASFVVQSYRTLDDARHGRYPHWSPDDKPIYPIVVTLEDWYLFGIQVRPYLDTYIRKALADSGIEQNLFELFPYTVMSVRDLEVSLQVMGRLDIQTIMRKKYSKDHATWNIVPMIQHEFPNEYRECMVDLFPEDREEIFKVSSAAWV
ncbi:hypothetical protein [Marivibrio sp.]|uniref:hypothetical protein n=1 Tax=Marivibrio sp. TaxID=2039719 RepID=UPI0032EB8645